MKVSHSNRSKIFNTFLFSNKILVFRAGINKIFRIANREDPNQAADLDQRCLSRSFWQAISVWNFRTFTVCKHINTKTIFLKK